jgi:hypothetical protein
MFIPAKICKLGVFVMGIELMPRRIWQLNEFLAIINSYGLDKALEVDSRERGTGYRVRGAG